MIVFPDAIWASISRYHPSKHDLICFLNSTHCPHLRRKHSSGWLAYPEVWEKPNTVQSICSSHHFPVPFGCYSTLKLFSHTSCCFQSNLKSKNLNVFYTELTKGELLSLCVVMTVTALARFIFATQWKRCVCEVK